VRWGGICDFRCLNRNVEELLAERGLLADHTTIWRWVQCYAPETEVLPSGIEAHKPFLEGG